MKICKHDWYIFERQIIDKEGYSIVFLFLGWFFSAIYTAVAWGCHISGADYCWTAYGLIVMSFFGPAWAIFLHEWSPSGYKIEDKGCKKCGKINYALTRWLKLRPRYSVQELTGEYKKHKDKVV